MDRLMINHLFEPMKRDPRYCGHMSGSVTIAESNVFGTLSMSVECGYPPDQHPTKLDNPPACGAPKGWRWGYLPCGCRNDGFGGHERD